MNHDDEKQLRILVWLHYVGAALAGAIPILGAAYAGLGVAMVLGRLPGMSPAKGEAFGWLPIAMGSFVVLIGVVSVGLNLLTARSLRDRKNHTLCLLTAAMNCVHFPFGTLFGAFTLIVLCRPAVRAAFEPPPDERQRPPAPSAPSGSPALTSTLGSR
jgi:hypothetical protein